MIFLRGTDGVLYKLTQTLAENLYMNVNVLFHESTFYVEIINNESSRITTINGEIYIDSILILEHDIDVENDSGWSASIANYCKLDTPFKLKVIASDPNYSMSLIRSVTETFNDIEFTKTETFPEEFTILNGLATNYIGPDTELRIKKQYLKGFAENFTSTIENRITKISGINIYYFDVNSFRESTADINISITSDVAMIFEDGSFEDFAGNLSFDVSNGDSLITVSKIGTKAFKDTQIDSFSCRHEGLQLGNYAFDNCQNLKTFYMESDEESTNRPSFPKGFFRNCTSLETIEGTGGFNYRGYIKAETFYNCVNLKYWHDENDVIYGKKVGIIELGILETKALTNCYLLPENNIFVLYQNSEIAEDALDGLENMFVLYPKDGSTTDEVKENFNLPSSAQVFLYGEGYTLKSNDTFLFFYHKVKNYTYHYMLRFLSDAKTFSFKEWLGRAPYYICSYCFTNSNLTKIYIPAGCTMIEAKAFYGLENLTIYCGDYEEDVSWNEDWNLKSKSCGDDCDCDDDCDCCKEYHTVIWNSKGW